VTVEKRLTTLQFPHPSVYVKYTITTHTRYTVWAIFSYLHSQEVQFILTNSRNAFRGQSRSINMVSSWLFATAIWNDTKVIDTIQRTGHGFLLVFYRNFVPKTHRFW